MTTDKLIATARQAVTRLKVDDPETADFHEGDRGNQLARLLELRALKKDVDLLCDLMAQDVANMMEGPNEIIAGRRVERRRSLSTKWDVDAYVRTVRTQILDQATIDPETGEVNRGRRHLIDLALNDYAGAFNKPTPSATAAVKVYGLNVDEFRTIDAGGWNVTIDGNSR